MEEMHDVLVRIDERTKNTYTLLKDHIEKDEKVQEKLEQKVNRNSKVINMFLGAVGLAGSGVAGWFGLDK